MFADKLKKLRKSRYLTQSELATLLGMKPSTIGMYEQGRRKPKLTELATIAEFFDVSTDYLISSDPQNTDVSQVITDFTNRLLHADGLMFNGMPLSEQEIHQLMDAIEISAAVILSKKEKKMTDEKH